MKWLSERWAAFRRWRKLPHPTKGGNPLAYEILQTPRGTAIVCLHCGSVSYNQNDIQELYCGFCHRFH